MTFQPKEGIIPFRPKDYNSSQLTEGPVNQGQTHGRERNSQILKSFEKDVPRIFGCGWFHPHFLLPFLGEFSAPKWLNFTLYSLPTCMAPNWMMLSDPPPSCTHDEFSRLAQSDFSAGYIYYHILSYTIIYYHKLYDIEQSLTYSTIIPHVNKPIGTCNSTPQHVILFSCGQPVSQRGECLVLPRQLARNKLEYWSCS